MINIKEYEGTLKKVGSEYFIGELHYVPNIMSWTHENNKQTCEPNNPMKLIVEGDNLSMTIQEEISDESLSDVIKNLSIRWMLRDNVTDINGKLNNIKKRLVYCFLKEYARSMEKTDGDELNEDEWVIEEMDFLGLFRA